MGLRNVLVTSVVVLLTPLFAQADEADYLAFENGKVIAISPGKVVLSCQTPNIFKLRHARVQFLVQENGAEALLGEISEEKPAHDKPSVLLTHPSEAKGLCEALQDRLDACAENGAAVIKLNRAMVDTRGPNRVKAAVKIAAHTVVCAPDYARELMESADDFQKKSDELNLQVQKLFEFTNL